MFELAANPAGHTIDIQPFPANRGVTSTTMDLYILRHAIAEPRTGLLPRGDSQRELTIEGAGKMRRVAQGMRAAKLSFEAVLSSPYVRARQTAEIVADEFVLTQKLELVAALAPDGSPEELIQLLNRDFSGRKSVLLVGHEPYLGRLISVLLTGGVNLAVNMRKAALCHLSIEELRWDRCATLEFLLTPGLAKRLG